MNYYRRKFINIRGILYDMNIMSRDKKSKVEDIVKLRKILDNSFDQNIKMLRSTDEKTFNSLRRRLTGNTLKPKSYSQHYTSTYDPLEPKVTVHQQYAVNSRFKPTSLKYGSSETLPEFQSVTPPEISKSIHSQESAFSSQELYEIEKINIISPDQPDNSQLPEWQPVEETQSGDFLEGDSKSAIDRIPEFNREDIPYTSKKSEKIQKEMEWEQIPRKRESSEELVEFLVVDTHEIQSKKSLKKQEINAKKLQKTKEKEAKRLKKLERKKFKTDAKDKKREAKEIKKDIEQQPLIAEETEFLPIKQKKVEKKPKKKLKDSDEWESYVDNKTLEKNPLNSICTYKEYTLYKKESGKRTRNKTVKHFFSKEKPELGHPARLPDGYQIAVKKNTGIPYLKKKR